MFGYITSYTNGGQNLNSTNSIKRYESHNLWESCQWQPAIESKHNIILYMLRHFYKVVWLWGHGHHARRASKITFVQRPNTSAVCTHGTQAAMLKNFSWKNFTPKQPEMSTNWFLSRLRRSHCHSLQVSCTLRLHCILSAIFSLGSFTPKETLKRSSASWPCLTLSPPCSMTAGEEWSRRRECSEAAFQLSTTR